MQNGNGSIIIFQGNMASSAVMMMIWWCLRYELNCPFPVNHWDQKDNRQYDNDDDDDGNDERQITQRCDMGGCTAAV